MKWDEQHGFLLTRTSVVRNAPEESGVYGLYSPGKWIYICHTSNIQKALLDYLSGRRPYVLQWQPKYFVFECLHYKERSARNKELVAHHQPVCNRLFRFKEPQPFANTGTGSFSSDGTHIHSIAHVFHLQKLRG